MTKQKTTKKYIAFLRGINVGGHHKLPMADLKVTLAPLGYTDIITILNSGNVIFDAEVQDVKDIEKNMEARLESTFGFPVPTCIREASYIVRFHESDPFKNNTLTKDIRFYVSFLKEHKTSTTSDITIPYSSLDNSYRIIEKREKTILSILDLSISQTPKAMSLLEKTYGKDITTRNWKTIERIIKKL
ncbi:MAG: hypothetical protein ACI9Y7_000432 [Dokdonia sp.]|jgi:uncharacterized protein (DUF1697 family)